MLRWLAIAALLSLSDPLKAEEGAEVDVALVLAVDISFSVSAGEQDVQRRGYAAAFRDPELVRAILSGPHRRIGVVYLEWAGDDLMLQITPWTLIDGAAAARRFADALDAAELHRGGRTSLSAALDKAAALLSASPYRSWRRVVDISGDGPNNSGEPVRKARDRLAEAGVTINGLPLVGAAGDEAAAVDMEGYFRDCVIGGPGAFYLTVDHWSDFDAAIKRKLILEIAGRSPPRPARLIRAAARIAETTDCLAGEKAARKRYIDRLDGLTGGASDRWTPREEDWPTPSE